MNGKYHLIVLANDKPSNKLCNILKLRNKTQLRKEIYIFTNIFYDECSAAASHICPD